MTMGESLTPTVDVTMQRITPGTAGIDKKIDPVDYLGQSWTYDQLMKQKAKEAKRYARNKKKTKSKFNRKKVSKKCTCKN